MLKGFKRKAGLLLIIVVFTVAGWIASPLLRPLSPRPPDRYNVVWISIDALRADHLGCYGYSRNVSPVIDRIAAQGVRFEHAYAQSSWTLPSSFSFLTARYPSAHGFTLTSLPPEKTFESIYNLNAFTIFDNAGFQIRGLLNSWYGAGVMGRLFPGEIEDAAGKAPGMMRKAKWFIFRNRHRPFFLLAHFMEVHSPYVPRKGYIEKFRDPQKSAVYDDDFCKLVNTGEHDLTPEELSRIKDNYDSGIAYMDDQVKELLALVDSLGLSDRTIVVITSDHGEAFMEHGFLAHSLTLYNEVMRIPLIIHVPGLAGGRVVADPVESIDLAPTLLELAGIDRPRPFQGKSLVPYLRGEHPLDLHHRDVFAEMTMDSWYYYPDHLKLTHGKTPGPEGQYVAAVISGKWKLIRFLRTGRDELYDLGTDPGEKHDLADGDTATANAMREKLDDYFKRNLDSGGVDVLAEAEMTDTEIWKRSYDLFPKLSKKVIEQLKGLGYLQ